MGVAEWVFPRLCVGCKREGEYVCQECWKGVKKARAICPMCGKPSVGGWTHPRCREKEGMERLVASYCYRGVLQRAMKTVKYKNSWEVVQEIGEKWVKNLARAEWFKGEKMMITSVPMYWKKERKRGFNQAEQLAELLAASWRELGWQGEQRRLLRRVRGTKPQYGMSRKERGENMAGAFAATTNFGNRVPQRVLLVDDIWTTGSTMRECSRVLKRNGIKEVWGVAVAC